MSRHPCLDCALRKMCGTPHHACPKRAEWVNRRKPREEMEEENARLRFMVVKDLMFLSGLLGFLVGLVVGMVGL